MEILKTDAKAIGFDDSFIYDQIILPEEQRSIPIVKMLRNEAIEAFEIWKRKKDKIEY